LQGKGIGRSNFEKPLILANHADFIGFFIMFFMPVCLRLIFH